MQIQGIGTDIVKIDRIKNALIRHSNFKTRIFTADEISYCDSKKKPELHYAMRFAGKEAISKAMGTGFRNFAFLNIDVMKDGMGKPYPTFNGNALGVLAEKQIRIIELSISFDHEYAIAFAIAMG